MHQSKLLLMEEGPLKLPLTAAVRSGLDQVASTT